MELTEDEIIQKYVGIEKETHYYLTNMNLLA